MRPQHLYEPYDDIEPFWKRIDWLEVLLIGTGVLCFVTVVVTLILAILYYVGA